MNCVGYAHVDGASLHPHSFESILQVGAVMARRRNAFTLLKSTKKKRSDNCSGENSDSINWGTGLSGSGIGANFNGALAQWRRIELDQNKIQTCPADRYRFTFFLFRLFLDLLKNL